MACSILAVNLGTFCIAVAPPKTGIENFDVKKKTSLTWPISHSPGQLQRQAAMAFFLQIMRHQGWDRCFLATTNWVVRGITKYGA